MQLHSPSSVVVQRLCGHCQLWIALRSFIVNLCLLFLTYLTLKFGVGPLEEANDSLKVIALSRLDWFIPLVCLLDFELLLLGGCGVPRSNH